MPQHLLRDGHEHLLHVEIVLGRRLEQLNVHLVGEPLRVLRDHHFPVRTVVLVAHQHLVHHITIVLDLLQPALHVRERLAVGHVVHDYHAVGAPIVRACDRPEALLSRWKGRERQAGLTITLRWRRKFVSYLSSRVPDLQFDPRAVQCDRSDLKIHTDRRDITAGECVVREADQQRRLAHSAVPDDE